MSTPTPGFGNPRAVARRVGLPAASDPASGLVLPPPPPPPPLFAAARAVSSRRRAKWRLTWWLSKWVASMASGPDPNPIARSAAARRATVSGARPTRCLDSSAWAARHGVVWSGGAAMPTSRHQCGQSRSRASAPR